MLAPLPPWPPSSSPAARSEMGAEAPEDARRIAELLPAGTPVYVNHLPRHELPHTLAALVAPAEAGLEPVPTSPRAASPRAPRCAPFLDQAVRVAGVAKALLDRGRRECAGWALCR